MSSKEYARNYYHEHKDKILADQRQYEIRNAEKIAARKRAYYLKNRDHILIRSQKYYEANTDKVLSRTKQQTYKRKKIDPKFKLATQLRSRLYGALKKKKWLKTNHFVAYIGCTLDELKLHIENLFKPGMTWTNHGEWHVDHIFPLAKAENIKHMYELCHYTNLQPLWAKENLQKQDKI